MLTAAEMSLNIKFLSLVEKRPCLFNSQVPADKNTIQRALEEIAAEMKKIYLERGESGISAEDCIKKWNNLRMSYLIYLQNYPSQTHGEYSKRYYLEDAMKFLQPHPYPRMPFGVPKMSPSVSVSTFREVNDKIYAPASAIGAGHKGRQSATNKMVNQTIGNWNMKNAPVSKNSPMSSTRLCNTAINNQQEMMYHKGLPINAQRNKESKNRVINTQISHDVRNNHWIFQGKSESNNADNFEGSDIDKLKATADKKPNFPALTKEPPQSSNSKAVVDIIKLEKAEPKSVNVLDNIKKEIVDPGFTDIKKIEKDEITRTEIWGNIKEEKDNLSNCTFVKEDNQVISQASPAFIVLSDNEQQLKNMKSDNTPNNTQLLTGCLLSKVTNQKSTKRKNETNKPLKNKKMKLESTRSQRGVRKLKELEDSRNLFLQSLLPDVRKLNDNQFRSFRTKVSDIMMEYFNKN